MVSGTAALVYCVATAKSWSTRESQYQTPLVLLLGTKFIAQLSRGTCTVSDLRLCLLVLYLLQLSNSPESTRRRVYWTAPAIFRRFTAGANGVSVTVTCRPITL